MFDIGIWELFVVGLIALIVLGPERLPGVARTLGLWIGRARAAFYSVREEVEREIHADGLRETQRALRREFDEGSRSIAQSLRSSNASPPPSQPPAETEPSAADGPEVHSRRAGQASSSNSQQEPEVDREESERSGGHRRQ